MVCEVCEEDLPAKKFSRGSTVCIRCLEKWSRLSDGGGYSEPQRESVNKGLLRLVNAIRVQAEMDGKLEEFKDFWVYMPPLSTVWAILWEERGRQQQRGKETYTRGGRENG